MSTLRQLFREQGVRLLSDARVMKLVQDERVMKAVVTALSVPGKVQSFAREQASQLARAMSLATEDDVGDLRRTVRQLEEEIAELKSGRDSSGTTR